MPSITVTGLSQNQSYDFRVAAANSAGTGAFSSTATASTTSAGGSPGQPQAIQTSTATNTTMTLSWTAPSSGGTPVTYVPQYKKSSSGTWLTYLVTTQAIDTAFPVSAFLSSLGVNTHLSYTQGTYGNGAGDLTALQYLGVKKIRDTWAYTAAGHTILDSLMNNGIQATFIANSTISTVLSALAVLENAHPGMVLAIEGPNETNNFPISFNGQSSPAADIPYQTALYTAVKADSTLSSKPVYYYTGNYTAGTLAGLADYANGHPYPTGNLGGDQPSPRIDSEYTGHFSMPLSSYARVGTETGYTTVNGIDQATQAKNTLNSYLDAFKQGLTEIYPYQLLADLLPLGTDEGFGLFNNDFTPKPVATAIHNMTTILQDTGPSFGPGQLAYSLTNLPALGKSLLLQKSTGTYELIVWSETQNWNDSTHLPITVSPTSVTVNLGATFQTVNVYDPISGTAPISTSSNVTSKVISITDHPLIVEMIGLSSPIAIPTQPAMSQIFSSLAIGTSYDFRVFAKNGSGSGPVSSVSTALTTGGAAGVAVPLALYAGVPGDAASGNYPGFNAQWDGFTSTIGRSATLCMSFMNSDRSPTDGTFGWSAQASFYSGQLKGNTRTINVLPVIAWPFGFDSGSGSTSVAAAIAAGTHDTLIQTCLGAWKANGYSTLYIRPAWEFNLPNQWAVPTVTTLANFLSAFQHFYTVVHNYAMSNGMTIKVIWNPNVGNNQNNAGLTVTQQYPGDAFVDVLGIDTYGAPVDGGHPPTSTTTDNTQYLVSTMFNMAVSSNKHVAFCEVGGIDQTFTNQMATALNARSAGIVIEFFGHFELNDSSGNLSWTNSIDNQAALAAIWRGMFGPGGSVTT